MPSHHGFHYLDYKCWSTTGIIPEFCPLFQFASDGSELENLSGTVNINIQVLLGTE